MFQHDGTGLNIAIVSLKKEWYYPDGLQMASRRSAVLDTIIIETLPDTEPT